MSSRSTPRLSVIVINWNSSQLTTTALETLRRETTDINYEVILIDNGSTKDESVSRLRARFPWTNFVVNLENRGFSKASNQGIRRARGEYVLLLNSDTIQIENALQKSVAYMELHPDVGALGILHYNNDGTRTIQPSFHQFPHPWAEIASLLGLSQTPEPAAHETFEFEQDVDWVCGSFLLIRRNCLDDVGLLDERFFIYDEDIDWCLRARRAGWKVRFWPGAAIIHLGAASTPHMRDKTFAHFRSHLTYIRKNHSLIAASAYYAAMSLRLGGATFVQALRYLVGRAAKADLCERYERQRMFLLLRPSQGGC